MKSDEFISWALIKINDPYYYSTLIKELEFRMRHFFASSQAVRHLLEDKLRRGKLEYGDAVFDKNALQLDSEIDEEFLDTLGWLLIQKFVEKHDE